MLPKGCSAFKPLSPLPWVNWPSGTPPPVPVWVSVFPWILVLLTTLLITCYLQAGCFWLRSLFCKILKRVCPSGWERDGGIQSNGNIDLRLITSQQTEKQEVDRNGDWTTNFRPSTSSRFYEAPEPSWRSHSVRGWGTCTNEPKGASHTPTIAPALASIDSWSSHSEKCT